MTCRYGFCYCKLTKVIVGCNIYMYTCIWNTWNISPSVYAMNIYGLRLLVEHFSSNSLQQVHVHGLHMHCNYGPWNAEGILLQCSSLGGPELQSEAVVDQTVLRGEEPSALREGPAGTHHWWYWSETVFLLLLTSQWCPPWDCWVIHPVITLLCFTNSSLKLYIRILYLCIYFVHVHVTCMYIWIWKELTAESIINLL